MIITPDQIHGIELLGPWIIAVGIIRKVGGGYSVFSEKSGKRLSKPTSKAKAVKRLRQIEYFKHAKRTRGR